MFSEIWTNECIFLKLHKKYFWLTFPLTLGRLCQFKYKTWKAAKQETRTHFATRTAVHREESHIESLEMQLKVCCLAKIGQSVAFSGGKGRKEKCWKQRRKRRKDGRILMSQKSDSCEENKEEKQQKLPDFKQTSHCTKLHPSTRINTHACAHPIGIIWASLFLFLSSLCACETTKRCPSEGAVLPVGAAGCCCWW